MFVIVYCYCLLWLKEKTGMKASDSEVSFTSGSGSESDSESDYDSDFESDIEHRGNVTQWLTLLYDSVLRCICFAQFY